jgi:hypothetical protein
MAFSSRQAAVEADLEAALKDLERFKTDFRVQVSANLSEFEGAAKELRLIRDDELRELGGRIEALVGQLQEMLTELRGRPNNALAQDEAVHLVATVNMLDAEIDALLGLLVYVETELARRAEPSQSFVGKAVAAVSRIILPLRNILKPALQKIAVRLWRIISGLMTPKEWSVGGELGNTVWGLTKVKLEIKFGP